MRLFYLPPALWSLTARRTEAGHAHRYQIYALKILQGVGTAAALGLLWVGTLRLIVHLDRERAWSSMADWEHVALLGMSTLAILVAEKAVDEVGHPEFRREGMVNPLDLLCDVALHQAWLLPFEFHYALPAFVVHVLAFASYPWSQE